jgi:hypothetical protein
MQISRRNALATGAAAIVTGAATAPLAKMALANGDPVIGLSAELNAAWKAWMSVDDRFEEACHKAGTNSLAGQRVCRTLGIESLWQEREHWKAQFWDLNARLLDTPATTARGVLTKMRGWYHEDEITAMRRGGDFCDPLPEDWAASIYRDLERLAGEARP